MNLITSIFFLYMSREGLYMILNDPINPGGWIVTISALTFCILFARDFDNQLKRKGQKDVDRLPENPSISERSENFIMKNQFTISKDEPI